MKLSNILLSSTATLLLSRVTTAVPNNIHQQKEHRDQHPRDKRDVVVVTEYVNQDGNVVLPAATATTVSSDFKQKVATATLTPGATLSPSATGATDTGAVSGSDTFQDGKFKCSEFPASVSGTLALDWLDLNGWSSIQDSNGQSLPTCQDGSYCSYACEPGMVKTQWPQSQPNNGASLGGLYCEDGYLYRTNKDADSLCQSTNGDVTVVNDNGKGQIALCRTDYPGSENMVVPTVVNDNGGAQPLAVVDQDNYYQWLGKSTSAQYYVNNAGVSVQDGCVWGDSSKSVGNWAPVVIGAGMSNGLTYLSLIPNPNNNNGKANFNIKFKGDDLQNGDDCHYINGKFSSSDGCTVSVISGSVQIIFY